MHDMSRPIHVREMCFRAALLLAATITKRGIQHVWSDYPIKDSFLPSCILLQFALGMGCLTFCNTMHLTQSSPNRAEDMVPSAGNKAALQVTSVVLMLFLFREVCSLSFCHGDPSSI